MCGVGKILQQWKETDTPNCPRCGAFEDADHVWKCQAPSARAAWHRHLELLNRWMSSGIESGVNLTLIKDKLISNYKNN